MMHQMTTRELVVVVMSVTANAASKAIVARVLDFVGREIFTAPE